MNVSRQKSLKSTESALLSTKRWMQSTDVKINEDLTQKTTFVCTICASWVKYHYHICTFIYVVKTRTSTKLVYKTWKPTTKFTLQQFLATPKYSTNFFSLENVFKENKILFPFKFARISHKIIIAILFKVLTFL